ncbi:MAG TPA: hypothetical protein VNT51_13275 [Miltoncostaeaceae bacterium]|nr:hypothetical protein [Miltoncostaeaceae bacterium]
MTTYGRAAALGMVAGLAGAAAMTAGEKLEQRLTRRPNSYVPAHVLSRVLRLSDPDADRWGRNMAMHYGQAALVGALRGVWSAGNLRGVRASLMFTPLRLSVDQTLENTTGVGAPPWTWPRDELGIDVLHKAVFSLATGAVADALIEPSPRSSAHRRFPSLRLRGFA